MLVACFVAPLGAGGSVTAGDADVVRLVREPGRPNQTDSMFTTLECDW